MNIEDVKLILKNNKISPNKVLGQNFLLDIGVVIDLVDAAGVNKKDTVLEIGPGLGFVTEQLANKAGSLVCVEKDRTLEPVLTKLVSQHKNTRVVYGDFLKQDLNKLFTRPYKMVANLPYYAASPIIRHCLDAGPRPLSLTFLIQKEVAENMAAKKGMNLLALAVQLQAEVEIVRVVRPKSFFPEPKVDSAIVHLKCFSKPLVDKDLEKQVFRVGKALFSGKRKQIHNTLVHNLGLSSDELAELLKKAVLVGDERPGALSLLDFVRLGEVYSKFSRKTE